MGRPAKKNNKMLSNFPKEFYHWSLVRNNEGELVVYEPIYMIICKTLA